MEYAFNDTLITNIYYSYTDDDFEQVTLIDKENMLQRTVPKNFIINKMFGLYQTILIKPFQWWRINVTADIYYSDTNSKIPQTLQHIYGWNAEFNLSNDIMLHPNKTLLLNTELWITTSGVDHLDYNSSDLDFNVSFKWVPLDKNVTLSLTVADIIKPKGMKYTSFSNGIKNTMQNYFDEQYIRIGAKYQFGKLFRVDTRNKKNQKERERTN